MVERLDSPRLSVDQCTTINLKSKDTAEMDTGQSLSEASSLTTMKV